MLFFNSLLTKDDEMDFEEIFNNYKYMVYSVSLKILKDEHYAEDATSETFYRIAKYYKKVKKIPSNEISYYIVAIAKNTAYTMYTQIHKRVDVLVNDDENCLMTDTRDVVPFIDKLEWIELYDAIDTLSDKQQTIFMYKYGYGFSIKEIASMLGEKENTVKVYLQRAKTKLARILTR